MTAKSYIEKAIREIAKSLYAAEGIDFKVERPPEGAAADYAVNSPFLLSKMMKKAPMVIGGEMALALTAYENVERVENVKGYLNITLKSEYYKKLIDTLLSEESFFKNSLGQGKKINLEFVSANPVGPLNIVSGRAASYGDTLGKILNLSGYKVNTEFYVNDFGRQMTLFTQTVEARYAHLLGLEAHLPEEGYKGDYVIAVAQALKDARGEKLFDMDASARAAIIKEFSLGYMLHSQKETLKKFCVHFDLWFLESSLYENEKKVNETELIFQAISAKGYFYENEGAIWFRTTDFGDDKDRVVKKQDGAFTYFMSDIAYMANKKNRGFDYIFNIMGPDHHGYISRLEAIIQALGYDKNDLKVILLQQVNLLNEGEKMKMSKRAGQFVSLDDLIAAVGVDAARYYFLMRNYNSHLDFDVALAMEKTDNNPVFYVQYAFARLCSVFKHAIETGVDINSMDFHAVKFETLEKEEKALLLEMIDLPAAIKEAALKYSPSVLVQYTFDMVSKFHTFYAKCRVITDDAQTTAKRLYLLKALKKSLTVAFKIMGITPVESM